MTTAPNNNAVAISVYRPGLSRAGLVLDSAVKTFPATERM